MPDKTDKQETTAADPLAALSQVQQAGAANMLGLTTAWFEAMGDMGAEVMNFVADRIKEDVKTQHQLLHSKSMAELQHVQAQFVQKAIDQYQEETGKLVEMTNKALQPGEPGEGGGQA